MSKTSRGVRMINENVVQPGRAFIITTEDFDDYNWEDLPDGTLHVDTKTGNISVKLAGETTWSPTGLKNDGTLVISKDTQYDVEVFTVTSVDNGDGNFIYTNAKGEQRYKPVLDNGTKFTFELENGTYFPGRNHLEVTIDDVLTRTVMSGGIEEINESRFAVCEPLEVGQEISVRYVKWTKIGNPYPRIFLNKEEPAAENGDIWIDPNGTLDDGTFFEDIQNDEEIMVPWDRISGKPNTLQGYGIDKQVAQVGHVHRTLDITDFPKSLPANGGDADTVAGREVGDEPGNIPFLDGVGKLDPAFLSEGFLIDSGAFFIQDDRPASPKNNSIWLCTAPGETRTEVYVNNTWIQIGAKETMAQNYLTDAEYKNNQLSIKKSNGSSVNIDLSQYAGSDISVTAGTIGNGGTIPVPSGFTREQCKYAVWPTSWAESVDGYDDYRCSVNQSTGVVSISHNGGTNRTAGYLCIAIK